MLNFNHKGGIEMDGKQLTDYRNKIIILINKIEDVRILKKLYNIISYYFIK